MIKVEKIEPWGFEHAIRGMRNPMNSWDKSDSETCYTQWPDWPDCISCMWHKDDKCRKPGLTDYKVGPNDLGLMQKLYQAGPEHRKYLRQIFVSMDITAPLYWWKEFDTYKVGTVSNSCSTMHKIAAKEFELDDFSNDQLTEGSLAVLTAIINVFNIQRALYLETKDKLYWWQMIQLLPSSYNQKRTITMNYENVISMIHQRTGHKLDEWNNFVKVLEDLPYIKEITAEVCV